MVSFIAEIYLTLRVNCAEMKRRGVIMWFEA